MLWKINNSSSDDFFEESSNYTFLGKVAPPTVVWMFRYLKSFPLRSKILHYLNISWSHCVKLLQLVCSFLQLSKYGKNSFGANVYTLKLLENWCWLKLLLAIKQGDPFLQEKHVTTAAISASHLKTYIDNNFCRTRNDPVNGTLYIITVGQKIKKVQAKNQFLNWKKV